MDAKDKKKIERKGKERKKRRFDNAIKVQNHNYEGDGDLLECFQRSHQKMKL